MSDQRGFLRAVFLVFTLTSFCHAFSKVVYADSLAPDFSQQALSLVALSAEHPDLLLENPDTFVEEAKRLGNPYYVLTTENIEPYLEGVREKDFVLARGLKQIQSLMQFLFEFKPSGRIELVLRRLAAFHVDFQRRLKFDSARFPHPHQAAIDDLIRLQRQDPLLGITRNSITLDHYASLTPELEPREIRTRIIAMREANLIGSYKSVTDKGHVDPLSHSPLIYQGDIVLGFMSALQSLHEVPAISESLPEDWHLPDLADIQADAVVIDPSRLSPQEQVNFHIGVVTEKLHTKRRALQSLLKKEVHRNIQLGTTFQVSHASPAILRKILRLLNDPGIQDRVNAEESLRKKTDVPVVAKPNGGRRGNKDHVMLSFHNSHGVDFMKGSVHTGHALWQYLMAHLGEYGLPSGHFLRKNVLPEEYQLGVVADYTYEVLHRVSNLNATLPPLKADSRFAIITRAAA